MYSIKKVGVFIPGRLRSERLPNKLVLPIGDTCLWGIACKKLNSLPEKFEKVALINDKALINISNKYLNINIIKRSEESTKIDEPLSLILKDLEQAESDYLMFLNPCMAFLSEQTIIDSLNAFSEFHAESATSVKKFNNWLYKDNTLITEVNKKSWSTKDVKNYYQAAHCFHIFNKDRLIKEDVLLDEKQMLIQVREEETIDVDTKNEYDFVKWKWENDRK